MGRADVDIEQLVRVAIRRSPELVDRFLEWTLSEGIHPIFPAVSSIGCYKALFPVEQTERISAWFAENNAGAAV